MASAEQQIKQCNLDIEDNPDNAKAYLNRAICYMHLRNYEETLNDAMQSTKLNDASPDAWYMLGQAHMGLGHYRAAISAFRRANQIDPANVHIRSAVLQAEQILEEVQQGKYAQATFSPGALNAGSRAVTAAQLQRISHWLLRHHSTVATITKVNIKEMSIPPVCFISVEVHYCIVQINKASAASEFDGGVALMLPLDRPLHFVGKVCDLLRSRSAKYRDG
ncbi:MAG: heat shock STI-like [Trebouxia sp. A1-2]|nr:MAG: heat shock STI-like [Trebouxia sp. A1-2]